MSELFDIEPSLSPRLKWMREHTDILTHHAPHLSAVESPWLAILKMEDHTGSVGAIMAEWCRLYDETGRCGYGATEEDAIVDLCRQQGIPLWNEPNPRRQA